MEKLMKGCIPDMPDNRDRFYEDEPIGAASISNLSYPASTYPNITIDLRDQYMPPIWDQGSIGACTAYSSVAAVVYQMKRNRIQFNQEPSRLYSYMMARLIGKYPINEDTGATLRGICKSLQKFGIAHAAEYPDTTPLGTAASFGAMYNAANCQINSYYSVRTFTGMMDALKKGLPIVIATDVDQFADADANGLSRKVLSTTTCKANHAMLIVGYIGEKGYYGTKMPVFIIRNSWGTAWGERGYCYVPADKMVKLLLADRWVVVKNTYATDEPVAIA
jgi:C1A family cysteine protease